VTARDSQGFPAGLSVHVFGLLAGCAVPAALGGPERMGILDLRDNHYANR